MLYPVKAWEQKGDLMSLDDRNFRLEDSKSSKSGITAGQHYTGIHSRAYVVLVIGNFY
jgi:hypothetical protein